MEKRSTDSTPIGTKSGNSTIEIPLLLGLKQGKSRTVYALSPFILEVPHVNSTHYLMGGRREGGAQIFPKFFDLDQIQNNGQPTVPLCSLDQTALVKKARTRKETTPEQIMLASKVRLVISGADHKLSITELNHSRGKNNEQAAQAAGGGGPIGRNFRENEGTNNILMGLLEAVFNCCLGLMSRNIQRITPWRARPHQQQWCWQSRRQSTSRKSTKCFA
jgi:hypothetical protein